MRRTVFALILLLHGLAHANAGMLAADGARVAPTIFWALASVSFLAAAFGLFGVRPLNRYWQLLALTGTLSSLVLLAAFRPATAAAGIALDVATLGILFFVSIPPRERREPGRLARVGQVVAYAALAYVTVVILTRPWHSRWGSSDADLRAALPGDELVPSPKYTIQHAVTIHAPPADVWPWLVQLGQDRGGFYSYDWLERAFGDRIRNADRIHPEWQTLHEGDLVRATQPDYLGGRFGPNLGWRVVQLEPNRVITLGGWGAFVLQPTSGGTRLIVRTRGAGKPNVALAPFGLLVFEPAHFIMERGMLLGIKERAERQLGGAPEIGL
jgi:uncharacterized protein YndB with AHSA1/START domain